MVLSLMLLGCLLVLGGMQTAVAAPVPVNLVPLLNSLGADSFVRKFLRHGSIMKMELTNYPDEPTRLEGILQALLALQAPPTHEQVQEIRSQAAPVVWEYIKKAWKAKLAISLEILAIRQAAELPVELQDAIVANMTPWIDQIIPDLLESFRAYLGNA